MQDQSPQPLNYARPERISPSAAKILGMTVWIIVLAPICCSGGFALALAAYYYLLMAFRVKGIAATLYFAGLIGFGVVVHRVAPPSGVLDRILLALFALGAVAATVTLCVMRFGL